ncbi:MAG TPA: hypothetical protein VIN32_05085 [Candidatus Limnocylindria bacterium]
MTTQMTARKERVTQVGDARARPMPDIDNGTHTVPDFAHAVRRHEVIAAIERSAASGERVHR